MARGQFTSETVCEPNSRTTQQLCENCQGSPEYKQSNPRGESWSLAVTNGRAVRVLLVDDDDALASSLCEALNQRGYDVERAGNGLEGLDRLKRNELPDVVVLDLSMPVLNGWEFRVDQRRHPSWSAIPVVVLSSDRSPQAAAIDAATVLEKPVTGIALAAAIEQALESVRRDRVAHTEKMASLGVLAAGIAHEINNPLAYVLSNVAFVMEELELYARALPSPPAPARTSITDLLAALSELAQGAERVRLLVKELRAFARSGTDAAHPLDVRQLLRASAKIVAHEIRLRAQLAEEFEDVPLVEASESRLGQVFINLLVNAAQAIPQGRAADHRITLRTRSEPHWVLVEIEDTGPGIAPEIASRLFEPFFTTKPVGEGTGLGLSICRQIVESLRGKISFESVPGRGTCFRIRLPALS
jgi:signal transduction histidine kinase